MAQQYTQFEGIIATHTTPYPVNGHKSRQPSPKLENGPAKLT